MAQTVFGIFKNSTEAQNAKQYLISQGFSDDLVDISSRSLSDSSERSSRQDHEEDWGDKISNFFSNLFGNETESSKYTRAAARGAIVTVHVQSSEEAEKAAGILDDYGAVDVDEFATDSGFTPEDQNTNTIAKEVERMGSFNSGRTGITNHIKPRSDSTQPAENITGMVNKDKPHEKTAIPIINEKVEPETTKITGDRQKVRSRIVDRPVDDAMRLKEVYVYIERTVINPGSPEEDITSFSERTVIVSDTGESPGSDIQSDEEERKLFNEVDQRKKAMQENLRRTESETENSNQQQKPEGDISNQDDKDHYRDEIHRQRPGII